MYDEEIGQWFARRHAQLMARYLALARDAEAFPGYAALDMRALRAVLTREIEGLRCFMVSDQAALRRLTARHREQADTLTHQIPLPEQIAFTTARRQVVIEMFEADQPHERLRRLFLQRLEECERYYRVAVRAIETERTLRSLGGDG